MGIGLFKSPLATLLLTPGRVGREDVVVGRALLLDKPPPGGAWLGIGAPGPVTLMCRCQWVFLIYSICFHLAGRWEVPLACPGMPMSTHIAPGRGCPVLHLSS